MSRRYPTVGELADRARALAALHPGTVSLCRIGTSRAGRPLLLLSAGHGERQVLVVAGPHANEPVGGATALRLADHLASGAGAGDAATWHLLLCLDPDGASRNEGWLGGPMSLADHYRHMFRPHYLAQPEWLPPLSDVPPLPETRALIALQDELRPVLQCSLHAVDVGGSFVQLTGDLPGIGEPLARSARVRDIPLERTPFDAFFWPSPAPGVFSLPEPSETDQFAAMHSSSADSTWCHPRRHGTVTAIVESPMWAADGVADPRPHPDPRGAVGAVCREITADADLLAELFTRVRPHADGDAEPLLRAVDECLGVCHLLAAEWSPGTFAALPGGMAGFRRSQVTALTIAARRIVVRAAGMMLQAAGGVPGSCTGERGPRGALDRLLTERCAALAADTGARWIPVADQVEHQFRVVLAAFEAVADTRPDAVSAGV